MQMKPAYQQTSQISMYNYSNIHVSWKTYFDKDNNGLFNATYFYINPYWLQFEKSDSFTQIIMLIFISIIELLSLISNSIVVYICLRNRNLALSNIYVVNLALIDILSPLLTYWMMGWSSYNGIWAFHKTGCFFYAFVQGYFGIMSIVTIAMFAVSRAVKIVLFPLRTNSRQAKRRRAEIDRLVMFAIWIYCLLMTIWPFFHWSRYTPVGFLTTCCFDYVSRESGVRSFIVFLFTFGFALPFFVLTVSYYTLIRHVKKSSRTLRGEENKKIIFPNRRCQQHRDTKLLITVAIVTVAFLLAWLPYACVALLGQFGPLGLVGPWLAMAPALCAKSSTVYNPVIYFLNDKIFRLEVKNLFKYSNWIVKKTIKTKN